MVRRRNRTLIPNGGLKLLAGDKVFLYTQSHLPHAQDIQICQSCKEALYG